MRLTALDVPDKTTWNNAQCRLWIDITPCNDQTTRAIPDEETTIYCIATGDEEPVIMGEADSINAMVVLLKAKSQAFGIKIPKHNICVRALLACGAKVARVGYSKASDELVMALEELLLMRIFHVCNDDHTPNSRHIVFAVGAIVADALKLYVASNRVLQF